MEWKANEREEFEKKYRIIEETEHGIRFVPRHMKNKERYAETLIEFALKGICLAIKDGKPCSCDEIECEECDLHVPEATGCVSAEEWGEAEYIEVKDEG